MKKKLIKVSSLILSGLMITSTLPTFAYEKDVNGNSVEFINYQNSEDSNVTNVYAEIGSEYKVTIPKIIVLSGIDKKADYYVKVKGDIAGYETVNVVPDNTVNLYTKNKASQAGIIVQDKTAWKFDNFDVDANGSIEASGLTAGKWSGTFNFNINLEDEQAMVIERVLGDLVLPPVDEWDSINVPVTATFGIGETGSMNALKESLDESESMSITSSNENVAVIENNSIIRAIAPGTTRITTTLYENEVEDKSFSFDLKVNESTKPQATLPEAGTKLSEMSFSQIQAVAKAGKTEDYNIKLGDIIKVNDSIDAEIISIGSDYIEFMTIQNIVDSVKVAQQNVRGSIIYMYNSSFYTVPQVNNGITNTAQVSYVGSNIQSEVNAWLDSQSDEFKSSLQNVEREYEVATLEYYDIVNQKYRQTITGTITDIEKVYIPTKAELENVYTISVNHRKDCSWTATPHIVSGGYYAFESFGSFYYGNNARIDYHNGYKGYGAVVLFRIG